MHVTAIIPQSQRTNSRTIGTENPSHTDQALRGFHMTIPRESLQSVYYLANEPTKTAQTTYVSYRRNTAAVLSASHHRTLDAQSRGPRLGNIPDRSLGVCFIAAKLMRNSTGVNLSICGHFIVILKPRSISVANPNWPLVSLPTIFMDQREGFTSVGEKTKGLSSPKNEHDPCVYKTISESSVADLVLYVNDILLIGDDVKMLGDIKVWLSTQCSTKGYGLDIAYAFECDKQISGMRRGGGALEHGQDHFQKSSKQATTGDSTMEAEYIVASKAAKEAVWMKNYIQELGVVPPIAEPVVVFCNNNGAIAQAKELRPHHHSKHILRCYYLLREMVSRGDVRMD
ncbi:UNVERIFIED_CONTAM: Retrovirus-related Pol polyprotein from transposon TNT 1-94 [Sesamum calycinum]|uniref:Retrovirus-related Pol polyprotein from transposon TNT 1-94 n=1 Tax=Sesamum calycinum TaxID=2727403 RepID=A0AAW2JG83_9LAMI